VVLVARDELADRLPVRGLGVGVDRLLGERLVRLGAEDAGGQPAVDTHGGGLVDDDDAVPVGIVEDLLGVRVVRRAERVGAEPVHEREVVDHEDVVVAFAAHGAVLVLAEALEIERLAVDEEARAVDLDRPDADRERVRVGRFVPAVPQLDGEVVEVALARPPRVGVLDGDLSRVPCGPGYLGAVGVDQRDTRLQAVGVLRLNVVADDARGADQVGSDGDVAHVRPRRRVQPDRPVQSRVVKEVEEEALTGAVGRLIDVARWDGLPGQDVVDDGGYPVLCAGLHDVGDFGLERRVAALVLGHLDAVDPHHRAMGGRAEVQDDPLADPAGRDPDHGLVPRVAHVVAHLSLGEDIVVAGGHGYRARRGRQAVPPAVAAADAVCVKREPPEAVE
jgi:hypothetical protein